MTPIEKLEALLQEAREFPLGVSQKWLITRVDPIIAELKAEKERYGLKMADGTTAVLDHDFDLRGLKQDDGTFLKLDMSTSSTQTPDVSKKEEKVNMTNKGILKEALDLCRLGRVPLWNEADSIAIGIRRGMEMRDEELGKLIESWRYEIKSDSSNAEIGVRTACNCCADLLEKLIEGKE